MLASIILLFLLVTSNTLIIIRSFISAHQATDALMYAFWQTRKFRLTEDVYTNTFVCDDDKYRVGQHWVYTCEYTKHRVYSCVIVY